MQLRDRHHCPHKPWKPGAEAGECLVTSYNTSYKQHAIVPRQSCKPEASAMRTEDPLSDKTTFRTDYIKHPLEKPYCHPQDIYSRPKGQIDTMTSYAKDFTEKNAKPAQLVKREGQRALPAKFEGEPTYKNDFRKWPLERLECKKQEAWVPSKQPFEGQSTAQRDFRRYDQAPRQSLRPSQATHMSDAPFDGSTGYRHDFIKHPISMKECKPKEAYKPSNVPFDGMTTFSKDFTAKQGQKTESCKPAAAAVTSNAPLEDRTTFRNDFRAWAGEKPYVHQPEPYRRPEGEIDLHTTNQLQFKQHPMQKVNLVKPSDGRVIHAGEFNGLTNYKADFKPWEMARNCPKPREGWVPNSAPFEGTATYKAHYTAHASAPAKCLRPEQAALASDAPFQDATMYRTEFVKKQASYCPVPGLDHPGATLCYVETDGKGHKFYAPCTETVTPLRRASSASAPRLPAAALA